MATIERYESLKIDGTSKERVKYILSLSNTSELENYLKENLFCSYSNVDALRVLASRQHDEKTLLDLFENASLPGNQRFLALKSWLHTQKDANRVLELFINFIGDENFSRL